MMSSTTKSLAFALLLAAVATTTTTTDAAPCTLCQDGGEMEFPDKLLEAEEIVVDNCGALGVAIAFVEDGSEDCNNAQTIGGFCGCPIPENACLLCPSGARVPEEAANVNLTDYPATDFISGAPEGSFLSCATMESLLYTMDKDDAKCSTISMDISGTCLCSGEAMDSGSGGGGATADAADTTAPSSANSVAVASTGILALAGGIMTWMAL